VLRRVSGECPGRLRRGYAGMSGRRGRYPTHSTENSEPDLHHKWFNHRSLSALPGRLAGVSSGEHRQDAVSAGRTQKTQRRVEAMEVQPLQYVT
jgi:hypothetical protein